jgi:hypothetical protein
MPLSASRACTGGDRARARGWPTGSVGGPPAIRHRRWQLEGSGGVVAGAGLPSAPWSARACAGWPRALRERRGEVGGEWLAGGVLALS